ncbi:hypothetical protein WK68_20310 [Burkholderia ubonensis]|nr:hypothetical protein WK68_20310 [Burkholderia ubonensis]
MYVLSLSREINVLKQRNTCSHHVLASSPVQDFVIHVVQNDCIKSRQVLEAAAADAEVHVKLVQRMIPRAEQQLNTNTCRIESAKEPMHLIT